MATEVDLVEVLAEGLQAVYEDFGERIQATRDTIRVLKSHGLRDTATWLERRIDRSECIEHGVCPGCGGELERKADNDWVPYGSTVAAMPRVVLWCPECGEV